jgi:hypothetical protein
VLGSSVPGAAFQRVEKALALSNARAESPPFARLQCPSKARSHNHGKTCGRREREAAVEVGGAILLTLCRCDGRRHLGLRDGVTLRGAALEGRPRPVRLRRKGSPPLSSAAPATTRCPLGCREGERRPHARKGACTHRRALVAPLGRGRVLRSVQRPVHVDRHYTEAAQAVPGGALDGTSRSGKPAKAGGTDTGVPSGGRCAARRVRTASARKAAWHVRKGRRLRPPSLRGFESSG